MYESTPKKFYEAYSMYSSGRDYVSPQSEFHICRYCNSTNSTFKNKAHFLPEFTGNKTIFSFNECDECNTKFSLYETNLNAFGGFKNSFVPIKGKKKYPKFKSNDGRFTNQFDGNGIVSKIIGKTDILKLENNVLKIKTETQTFTPLYVYKAIVKFALSMLKAEDIYKFTKTFEWIRLPEKMYDDNLTPLILIYNESRPPLLKPLAILCKRKNIEINAPEFSFIFGFGFHRLQIFLPFNSADEEQLSKEKIIFPLNFHSVTRKEINSGKWSFAHFDMNFLNKARLTDNFKLNVTPRENDSTTQKRQQ